MKAKDREALVIKAKLLYDEGYTIEEIAKEVQKSAPSVYKWLREDTKITAKYTLSRSVDIAELRDKKVVFEQVQTPQNLLNAGFSVYDYGAENIGKNAVLTEERGFSRAMLNIPYINLSPAKRIQQAVRSMYEWRQIKKDVLRAYRRFSVIETPDIPKYIDEVKYHDLDTVNAVVGIAETTNDSEFTRLDACIISRSFADRVILNQTYQQTLYIKNREILLNENVVEGQIYETLYNTKLNKNNEIKLSGKIIKIKKTKTALVNGEKIKIVTVIIESHHKLNVGDKLRSLTGLKVIVGEVREPGAKDEGLRAKGTGLSGSHSPLALSLSPPAPSPDIIINMNQVISKTGDVKGALVREIKDNGCLAVGVRHDEILGSEESLILGSSISPTLYPVLKVYDPNLLRKIIRLNTAPGKLSLIQQLLLSLHLRIGKDGVIVPLPEADIMSDIERDIECEYPHYAELAHYFWDYDAENEINQHHKKFVQSYQSDNKLASTEMLKYVWDYLYIPDFILPFYISKGTVRDSIYVEYLDKTWEERLSTPGKGKHPFFVKQRASGTTVLKKAIKMCLFPKMLHSKYLKAIPTLGNRHELYVELSSDLKGCDENGYVTIYREPVIDEFGIWCLPVKYSSDIPKYSVRVPPIVMEAMNADFDGDDVCVLPYKSDYFQHQTTPFTPIKHETIKDESIDSLYEHAKYASDEDVILNGLKHMVAEKKRQHGVKSLGGLRNRVAFELESVDDHKKLFDLSAGIEDILKPERSKKHIKELTQQMKNLFPKQLHADAGESSYIVLREKHGKLGENDVAYLMGFDTRVSEFWKELWL